MFGLRINSHILCQFRIFFFIRSHSIRRVQVEGYFHVILFEVSEESFRIRKQVPVPGPTSPTAFSLFRIMPVHIYYQYIQRNLIRMEIINQITEFLIRVQPIARPPVTERIAGWQRHFSGKKSIIFQSCFIIMSISHEVPVLPAISRTLFHPIPILIIIKQKSLRIIDESPAVRSQQTIFQFQFFTLLCISHPSLCLRITIHTIQCTISTFQVTLLLHTGFPGKRQHFFSCGDN